jgi:hypothetical protein
MAVMAVSVKFTALRDDTVQFGRCYQCFRRTYCLQLQGKTVKTQTTDSYELLVHVYRCTGLLHPFKAIDVTRRYPSRLSRSV